jgi:hypothetical protein
MMRSASNIPAPADIAVDAMQASHTADHDRKSSYRQK